MVRGGSFSSLEANLMSDATISDVEWARDGYIGCCMFTKTADANNGGGARGRRSQQTWHPLAYSAHGYECVWDCIFVELLSVVDL